MKVGGWAALAAATLLGILVLLPAISSGLADLVGLSALGFIQSVLFVVAAVTLRSAMFGASSIRGEVAVIAAIVAATAGVAADLAAFSGLPSEVVIVAAIAGQVGNAAWYLLAATSLARAGSLRPLRWLGLAGSLAYSAAAAALAIQVLTDNYVGEAVLYLYLLVLLAIAFLAGVGWFAITGVQLRARSVS